MLAVDVLLTLLPDPGEGGGLAEAVDDGDGGGDVFGGVGGGGPTSSCPEIRLGRLLNFSEDLLAILAEADETAGGFSTKGLLTSSGSSSSCDSISSSSSSSSFASSLALAAACLLLANLDAGDMKLVPKFLMPGKVALRFARPPLPVDLP